MVGRSPGVVLHGGGGGGRARACVYPCVCARTCKTESLDAATPGQRGGQQATMPLRARPASRLRWAARRRLRGVICVRSERNPLRGRTYRNIHAADPQVTLQSSATPEGRPRPCVWTEGLCRLPGPPLGPLRRGGLTACVQARSWPPRHSTAGPGEAPLSQGCSPAVCCGFWCVRGGDNDSTPPPQRLSPPRALFTG